MRFYIGAGSKSAFKPPREHFHTRIGRHGLSVVIARVLRACRKKERQVLRFRRKRAQRRFVRSLFEHAASDVRLFSGKSEIESAAVDFGRTRRIREIPRRRCDRTACAQIAFFAEPPFKPFSYRKKRRRKRKAPARKRKDRGVHCDFRNEHARLRCQSRYVAVRVILRISDDDKIRFDARSEARAECRVHAHDDAALFDFRKIGERTFQRRACRDNRKRNTARVARIGRHSAHQRIIVKIFAAVFKPAFCKAFEGCGVDIVFASVPFDEGSKRIEIIGCVSGLRRHRKKRTARGTVVFDKCNDGVRRTGKGCDTFFTCENRRPIDKREGREKAGGVRLDDDNRSVRKAGSIGFYRIAEPEAEKHGGAAFVEIGVCNRLFGFPFRIVCRVEQRAAFVCAYASVFCRNDIPKRKGPADCRRLVVQTAARN